MIYHLLEPVRMAFQEKLKIKCWQICKEKHTLHIIDGFVNQYVHSGKQY